MLDDLPPKFQVALLRATNWSRAFGWRLWKQQENWLKEKDRQKGTEKL
jgi:TRAP-type C4-dicarboxylate transport system substrate-binding protein